jgi:1,4-alpha-glucan branching enzyme
VARILKKRETFAYVQPGASSVELLGDFTDWEKNPIRLQKQKDGTWATTVVLVPGAYEYRYRVDGEWRNDTQCTRFTPNPFGAENCVRVVN